MMCCGIDVIPKSLTLLQKQTECCIHANIRSHERKLSHMHLSVSHRTHQELRHHGSLSPQVTTLSPRPTFFLSSFHTTNSLTSSDHRSPVRPPRNPIPSPISRRRTKKKTRRSTWSTTHVDTNDSSASSRVAQNIHPPIRNRSANRAEK